MSQPIYHVSVSPTDGNGPTQGQRKTLTRVGFRHKLICNMSVVSIVAHEIAKGINVFL